MATKREKVVINKYSANALLKAGVIINIIFASLMSLILPLVLITIPAIVLNSLLLVPRVDTKRYHAFWRVIPVALIILLTTILVIAVLLVLGSLDDLYLGFANFVDTYVIFWTKKQFLPTDTSEYQYIIDSLAITLAVIGATGSTLTMFGWYKKKAIGEMNVPIVVSKKETKKDNPKKEVKKTKKKSAK